MTTGGGMRNVTTLTNFFVLWRVLSDVFSGHRAYLAVVLVFSFVVGYSNMATLETSDYDKLGSFLCTILKLRN